MASTAAIAATPTVSQSVDISTKSSGKPSLAMMHHLASFDVRSAPNNPQSLRSTSSAPTAAPQQMASEAPMPWDVIKKHSLSIPANALSAHKVDSASKLGLLQESFAVNSWQKLQDHSYPAAKLLRHSQSVRRMTDGSRFEVAPKRKEIDIQRELSL